MVAILCALALTTRKTTDDHLKLLLFWLASQCIRRISLQRALRKRPSPLPSCQDRQDLCIVLQWWCVFSICRPYHVTLVPTWNPIVLSWQGGPNLRIKADGSPPKGHVKNSFSNLWVASVPPERNLATWALTSAVTTLSLSSRSFFSSALNSCLPGKRIRNQGAHCSSDVAGTLFQTTEDDSASSPFTITLTTFRPDPNEICRLWIWGVQLCGDHCAVDLFIESHQVTGIK